jgi:hypothetical protein
VCSASADHSVKVGANAACAWILGFTVHPAQICETLGAIVGAFTTTVACACFVKSCPIHHAWLAREISRFEGAILARAGVSRISGCQWRHPATPASNSSNYRIGAVPSPPASSHGGQRPA